MFRRSSYASVLSGSAPGPGQPQFMPPGRPGTFIHGVFTNNGSFSHTPPQHAAMNHSRHASRSGETDGHVPWGRGVPYTNPGYTAAYHGEDSPPPLFVPSYLKHSRYAERAEDAHKAKVASYRQFRSNHSSNAGSLSTSSSSVNLHKMVPSHRGLTHDIIERAPVVVEDPVAPWPTKWNEEDKWAQLEIQGNGLEARFTGPHKAQTHEEAASVRADHPIPRQCGIYYYEVTVVSRIGKEGTIGVGFAGPKVPLSRIPGWEPESYAYHGDDGQCFSNSTSGKPYGPKFGSTDVVGCGINFRTGTAFFTKNGVHLGNAFKDIKTNQKWFPTVGMKKSGESLRVNFGQEPFVFDIDNMVEAERTAILTEISQFTTPISEEKAKETPRSETDMVHDLIAQYLGHDGYVETARAFAEEVIEASGSDTSRLSHLSIENDVDAVNRQKIRSAILAGDIDKALKHTMAYYPSVLGENEDIYFKLKCRKFIEMIRLCNELQYAESPSSKTNGNGDYDIFEHQMELDEQFKEWGADHMDTEDPAGTINDDFEYTKLMSETLKYGQELKSEFSDDTRREWKKALTDTFALVAYADARKSSLAPLLEESGRVPVAEELNSAILVSLGKSSSAAIERLCQQTEALVDELAEDGGPGAFINVKKDFLH